MAKSNSDPASARSQTGLSRILLFAVAFISGWSIMLLEILGGRVLAPFFGYSVYQWGALIGVVMAALALGYLIGGRIGDGPNSRRFLLIALLISAVHTVTVPRFADDFMPLVRAAGPSWGAVLGTFFLLGVPSVLLATTSPIVIRLTASERIANSAGVVYAVSTIGSIGGTFFAAFYVIPELGTRIGHYVATVFLAVAIIIMVIEAGRGVPAIAGAAVTLAFGYPFAGAKPPGEIHRSESLHNIIIVTDSPDQRSLYLNYSLGAQTVMSKRGLLTGGYYDFYLLAPHINDGKKVLFLGVAGGTALKQLVTTYPDVSVTGVELDPKVIDVARTYFGLDKAPRTKLIAEDARWFLTSTTETYDIIAIDLYVTGHIPFFTTTKEFFALAHERLSESGIIVMNVLSVTGSGELLGPLVKTVRTVFPSTFLVSQGNFMLIATKRATTLETMRDIFARQGINADVQAVLDRSRPTLRAASARPDWPVFTDDKNDVEFRTFRSFFGGR